MQLFYSPDISESTYRLSEEESKHCIRVLRKSVGDCITLIDGRGGLYGAEIIDDSAKHCVVKVVDTHLCFGKRGYKLHMAVAPTKSIDRYEWFLEKATEIGIDKITPLECFNSERRVVKDERSEKVILSAVKQSVKAYCPVNDPMESFTSFIDRDHGDSKLFIAHCHEGAKQHLKEVVRKGDDVVVMIGPEGDFSVEELERAKAKGFVEISLGDSRLRTETAALVAVTVVSINN